MTRSVVFINRERPRRPASHVARWIRSESAQARRLPALQSRRAPRPARHPARRLLLRSLARRIDEVHREPVCAVVESMTGARLIHDTLEREGWAVEIADAQKVKGLAPLALKTDKTDSLVLETLSQRDLVPAIWLPDPHVREERELARFRLHLVKHKSALKNRIHSTLINFGRPCPVTDLFGVEERAPGPPRRPRALALERDRFARADRRARGPDRSGQPPASRRPRRPSLHPALDAASRGSVGCWRLRSPPRSARSNASHRPRS